MTMNEGLILMMIFVGVCGGAFYFMNKKGWMSLTDIQPIDDAGNPPFKGGGSTSDGQPIPEVDYSKMKKVDLVALAKEQGIKGASSMTKDQIVSQLK